MPESSEPLEVTVSRWLNAHPDGAVRFTLDPVIIAGDGVVTIDEIAEALDAIEDVAQVDHTDYIEDLNATAAPRSVFGRRITRRRRG